MEMKQYIVIFTDKTKDTFYAAGPIAAREWADYLNALGNHKGVKQITEEGTQYEKIIC